METKNRRNFNRKIIINSVLAQLQDEISPRPVKTANADGHLKVNNKFTHIKAKFESNLPSPLSDASKKSGTLNSIQKQKVHSIYSHDPFSKTFLGSNEVNSPLNK